VSAVASALQAALASPLGTKQLLDILSRFHDGTLTATGKPPYWYWIPGDVLVSTNDLPTVLRTGLFTPVTYSKIFSFDIYYPEVSICTNDQREKMSGECIAVSWYLRGLLIGPPGFTNSWNPWYCRELSPGIYSYHGMR